MAEQSLNDKIALLGTSIQALNRESSYERDKEAKKLYKKLIDLINETKEREEWARRHSRTGDEMQDIRDTFEKLEDHMRTMSDIMGESFHDLQQQQRRQNSRNNGFSSSFDANDPVIPEGMRRSGYGKTTDAISNLGGLFGSSKLQTLGSILSGQTDITSGKMMKVAEKLNFAGKLLGGQNTKIGAKLLRGRDFFERNQSFLANYLSGKLNTSENRYSNPFPGGWDSMRPRGPQAIPESFIQQEHPQQNTAQPQNNPLSSSSRINRRENDRGYEQVGKKISDIIKKFLAPEGFEEANAQRMREMRRLNKIFGKLNKNMLKMDGTLGKFMGGLKDSLKGLLKKGGGGAIQALLKYFMMGKFAKMLGGVFKGGAGIFGKTLTRAVPMLGSAIAGAAPLLGKALVAAGPALAVGFAGAAGLALGKVINDKVLTPFLENTKIGRGIVKAGDKIAAKVGIRDAVIGKNYIDQQEKISKKNVDVNAVADTLVGKGEDSLTPTQRDLLYSGRLTEEHLSNKQRELLAEKDPNYKETLAKIRKQGGLTSTDGTTGKQRYEKRIQKGETSKTEEELQGAIKKEQETFRVAKQKKEMAQPQQQQQSVGDVKTEQVQGQSLGDIISSHEGTYNDVNRGAAHGYKSAKRNLTNMTVEQVMELQDSKDFNAAGKPQVIRDTLKGLVKQGVIDPKAMFNEKTQNDILVHLTEKRAGGYITGRHNNINASLDDISKEWASVENPYTGRSYYDKDGVNKAHTSAADVGKGLEQARELYQQNIAAGMPHKEAFRAAVLGQKATGEQSVPGKMKAQPQSEAAKVAALSEVGAPGSERFGLKMNADGSISKESISQNFSTRGKVDLTGMNPLFMSRANSFADEFKSLTGENVIATEGHRSKAEQERLYNLYKSGKGNLAARPGTSNHGHGLAMDLSAKNMEAVLKKHPEVIKQLGAKNARDAIDKLASKHGLHRPMKHRADEQQHFEMIKDQEYKDNINEAMIAEVRGKLKSGSYKGSSYLKEDSGIDYNRTRFMAEDGMNQEALASVPPIINMPQQKSGGGQQDSAKGGGGPGPMGAGNQDQLMTFMFGAYGYPTHLG